MALDHLLNDKGAVSDLTDHSSDGPVSSATSTIGYSSDGSVGEQQTTLASTALDGDDGKAASFNYAPLAKPVTVSLMPTPSLANSAEATQSSAFTTPSVIDLFSGNSADVVPQSGAPSVDFSQKGGPGGGGGSGGSGGGSLTPYSAQNAAGMKFVINWDSSVGNAPSGFQGGVESAVKYFLNTFASPITISINVGWGEVNGSRLFLGTLGESETNINQYSYSQIYNAMSAEATTGTTDQQSAVANLPNPSTSPNGPIANANYWVSNANAKALNLPGTATTTPDGWVGFGKVSWYFGSGTQSSGQYDFISVAEHEISEVMGRIALLGSSVNTGTSIVTNSYENLDLFRYSSAGTLSTTGGPSAYLSFDGGNTALNYFNTTAGGDWGDWQSSGINSAGNDAYDAFSSSGTPYQVSAMDGRELNVLGYTLTSPLA